MPVNWAHKRNWITSTGMCEFFFHSCACYFFYILNVWRTRKVSSLSLHCLSCFILTAHTQLTHTHKRVRYTKRILLARAKFPCTSQLHSSTPHKLSPLYEHNERNEQSAARTSNSTYFPSVIKCIVLWKKKNEELMLLFADFDGILIVLCMYLLFCIHYKCVRIHDFICCVFCCECCAVSVFAFGWCCCVDSCNSSSTRQ